MAIAYERHRITVEEYHRMAEAGIFEPDARIELIEGELIEMPTIGKPHSAVTVRLGDLLLVIEFAESSRDAAV